MAFNLPPPWDAGYALPDNVQDEGLERRGFVTKQMPRGTYDQPKVGTGGYVVPGYVMKEGYGQGTVVTKWMPRGTQPNVPHYLDRRPQVVAQRKLPGGGTQVTMALSGTDRDTPDLYRKFGDRAAATVLAQVARLPQDQRKAQLKRILDTIDPTLWRRTAALAEQYKRAGLVAGAALAAGLAQAMASGMANEVVQTGIRRTAPQPRSLLGLGCYGRQALGATPIIALTSELAKLMAPAPTIAPGTCSADGVYIFTGTAWSRRRADQPCTSVSTITGTQGSGGTGVTITGSGEPVETKVSAAPVATGDTPMIKVGPFLLPLAGAQVRVHTTLTAEQQQFVDGAIKHASSWGIGGTNMLGIQKGTYPFAKFQRPTRTGVADPFAGRMFGLYRSPNADGTSFITYKEYVPGDGIFESIWKGIKAVAAAVVDVVKAAVDAVGGIVCMIAQSPGAIPAGAAAGVAAGAGPAAGAGGAALAQQLCAGNPPPPPLAPPFMSSSSFLPVAIAAGGVVVVAALLSRKKKHP